MTVAIVSLVASVLGFIFFLVRRNLAAVDATTPEQRVSEGVDKVAHEIITDDAAGANRRVDDWLRKIQGDQRR